MTVSLYDEPHEPLSHPSPQGIIAMQVQFFYAWRLHKLIGNKLIVAAIVSASLVGGCASARLTSHSKPLIRLRSIWNRHCDRRGCRPRVRKTPATQSHCLSLAHWGSCLRRRHHICAHMALGGSRHAARESRLMCGRGNTVLASLAQIR